MSDRELCGACIKMVCVDFYCSRAKGHKKRHRATGEDSNEIPYVLNWGDTPAKPEPAKRGEQADD